MRLLLDTHSFLWFVLDDPQLSHIAKTTIEDPTNDIELSPVSYWEIAIKIALGNYVLPEPYQAFMERQIAANQFRILAIEIRHTSVLTTLPHHHRDPFDRLIVAQALAEGISIISRDPRLDAYGVIRVW